MTITNPAPARDNHDRNTKTEFEGQATDASRFQGLVFGKAREIAKAAQGEMQGPARKLGAKKAIN
jgi:hypothetical protein